MIITVILMEYVMEYVLLFYELWSGIFWEPITHEIELASDINFLVIIKQIIIFTLRLITV